MPKLYYINPIWSTPLEACLLKSGVFIELKQNVRNQFLWI